MKCTYSTSCDEHETKYSFENEDKTSLKDQIEWGVGELVAQEIAEDYHNNHDGWEDTWPIEFKLYDEDDKCLGTYDVEREETVSFSANEKE